MDSGDKDAHLFSIRTRESTKNCGYAEYTKDQRWEEYDLFTCFNSKITLVENYIGQKLA